MQVNAGLLQRAGDITTLWKGNDGGEMARGSWGSSELRHQCPWREPLLFWGLVPVSKTKPTPRGLSRVCFPFRAICPTVTSGQCSAVRMTGKLLVSVLFSKFFFCMACFIWNLEEVLGKAARQLPFCTRVLLMDLNYLVVLVFPKILPKVKEPKARFSRGGQT